MSANFTIHLPAHGDPAFITEALNWWETYLREFPDDTGEFDGVIIEIFDPAEADWPRHAGLAAHWAQSYQGFLEAMFPLPDHPAAYHGFVSSEAL